MRDAYSIAIGEPVVAEELDYGMCEDFLVCCPVCHESVIKKELRRPGGVTHYLAHRRRTPEQAAECERRVAAMSRDEIRAAGALARGQDLARFFAAFEDVVVEGLRATLVDATGRGRAPGEILREVKAAANFRLTATRLARYAPKLASAELADTMDEAVMDTIRGTRDSVSGTVVRWTPRQEAAMRRLAADVRVHLATPQGEPNLRTVLAAGALRKLADPKPVGPGPLSAVAADLAAQMLRLSRFKYERRLRQGVAAIRRLGPPGSPPRDNPEGLLDANLFLELYVMGARYAAMSPFTSRIWQAFRERTPDWDARVAEHLVRAGAVPPPG